MNEMMWGYAWEKSPERWLGSCDSREEAIKEAMEEAPRVHGDTPLDCDVWIVRGRPCSANEFTPDAHWVIDYMAENARDGAGAEDYPDVSDEARAELDALIEAWAAKHCSPNFWMQDGEPERVWPPSEAPTVELEAE